MILMFEKIIEIKKPSTKSILYKWIINSQLRIISMPCFHVHAQITLFESLDN